jgi:hypothetical protein
MDVTKLNKIVEVTRNSSCSLSTLKETLSDGEIITMVRKAAVGELSHRVSQAKRAYILKEGARVLYLVRKDPEMSEKLGLGTRA